MTVPALLHRLQELKLPNKSETIVKGYTVYESCTEAMSPEIRLQKQPESV